MRVRVIGLGVEWLRDSGGPVGPDREWNWDEGG